MFMNMATVFLSNRRANRPSGFSQFLGSIANRRAKIQKIRRKRPEIDFDDVGMLGGLIIGGGWGKMNTKTAGHIPCRYFCMVKWHVVREIAKQYASKISPPK
jgi:hypothetical protein